jgi:hypothetical protein
MSEIFKARESSVWFRLVCYLCLSSFFVCTGAIEAVFFVEGLVPTIGTSLEINQQVFNSLTMSVIIVTQFFLTWHLFALVPLGVVVVFLGIVLRSKPDIYGFGLLSFSAAWFAYVSVAIYLMLLQLVEYIHSSGVLFDWP